MARTSVGPAGIQIWPHVLGLGIPAFAGITKRWRTSFVEGSHLERRASLSARMNSALTSFCSRYGRRMRLSTQVDDRASELVTIYRQGALS
jgi:hypothetical protein